MKDLIRAAKQMSMEQFISILTDGDRRKIRQRSGTIEYFWLRHNDKSQMAARS